jgi:putative transposase
MVAVGVNTEGQCEVHGLKLVISNRHGGIKAAASKVHKATWQRCPVQVLRNALFFAEKTQRRMVSAAIGTVLVQDTPEAAKKPWRSVADPFRDKLPKLAKCMDEAEADVLAFMTSPFAHWPQIYSKDPLEQLNAEIKRRTNAVGIFPNDASITRLFGALMLEQSGEWSLNRRHMQLEGLQTDSDPAPTRLPAVAR